MVLGSEAGLHVKSAPRSEPALDRLLRKMHIPCFGTNMEEMTMHSYRVTMYL